MNRTTAATLAAAALALGLSLAPGAQAQQLIAWPVGARPWLHLLPGSPIRPMPMPPHPTPLPLPRPIPSPEPASPVTLSGYIIEGDIDDQVANLTYRIVFHNPGAQRLEGVLLVPMAPDAVLSDFSMTVGDKKMNGELLNAGQASTIYENIVRQQRDPALLELVGERLFRARVFPIEPNSDVSVKLSVAQILHKNGGLTGLTLPLRSAQMVAGTRGAASVRLRLRSSKPLRTLYSPDDRLRLRRTGDSAAEIAFEGGASREDADLSLFFSTQEDPLAAGLLTYRESGEDGFFMLSLSPKTSVDDSQATPKDVVFIVDRSGSMEEGGKMEQERKALAYCIRKLSPKDRFGVVDFATDWNELDSQLLAANPENKQRALRYVERIEAAGGTNIEAGLTEGLRLLKPQAGRMPLVFFMTDGLPTVGQTDVTALLRQAQEGNKALQARLFSFGVGSDVNTLFLDKLAQGNRGTGDYVQPGENIEAKVSSLYQKVARPAMTDVRLAWEGVDVVSTYPRPVNDLFYGSELVVMGRYKAAGRGKLVVTGQAGGKAARFEFPLDLPESAPRLSFLPRLWANMRVSHELDALRLSGTASPEVVADIVRLAKRYGIVTPYTSFLITEEGRDAGRANALALRAVRGAAEDAAQSGFGGGAGVAMRAQKASGFLRKMAAAPASIGAASELPSSDKPQALLASAEKQVRDELKAKGENAVATRQAGGKTFYRRGEEWVDGDAEDSEPGSKVVELRYLSAAYFEALQAHPELGRYFAVGSPLRVRHGGTIYKIVAP